MEYPTHRKGGGTEWANVTFQSKAPSLRSVSPVNTNDLKALLRRSFVCIRCAAEAYCGRALLLWRLYIEWWEEYSYAGFEFCVSGMKHNPLNKLGESGQSLCSLGSVGCYPGQQRPKLSRVHFCSTIISSTVRY